MGDCDCGITPKKAPTKGYGIQPVGPELHPAKTASVAEFAAALTCTGQREAGQRPTIYRGGPCCLLLAGILLLFAAYFSVPLMHSSETEKSTRRGARQQQIGWRRPMRR